MAKPKYDNQAITALKGADRVRLRPAVIFGSEGIEGCQHAAFEIISNSIDEAREGYGKKIIITLYNDHSISVEDFGRGIPIEMNEKEKEYNWKLVFCELYAGGKYQQDEGENYAFALGLNGLGACATQYASRWMKVRVRRDGFEYNLSFERGENKAKKPGYEKAESKAKTGTFIHWLPDLDVFTDINIDPLYLEDLIRKQAVVNEQITFLYRVQDEQGKFTEQEISNPGGITGYIAEICENPISPIQEIHIESEGKDREDKKAYKLKTNIAFCFGQGGGVQEYYHNSSFLEHGGSPLKAVRAAFTYSVDKYIKAQGKYLKNEAKVTTDDILDSLVIITNCFSSHVSYENQTKKAITNKFVQDEMTNILKDYLDTYFAENKVEANKIITQILINKRSREQAEKNRISVKKKLGGTVSSVNAPEKYVDCRSKDSEKRELYIVEGDSALGSCIQARDADYQALMPIRGKILSCLKVDLARIFKSEIITDLIRLLGCGVEVKTGSKDIPQFDIEKLKFSKIIFCTDADVDGYQIRCLLLAMIYRLCPTLIREGKIYIAETPLYEITCKKETLFAYDEVEKAEILKKFGDKNVKIQRSKGLGENDAEMMNLTTMNPETRRLIRVTASDAEEISRLYDVLLGDDIEGRKAYIEEYGEDFLAMLDLD